MVFPHGPHATDVVGTIRPDICPDCREWIAGWLTNWTAGDRRTYVLRLRDDVYAVTMNESMTDRIMDLLVRRH
jgi:hypothetical protein